MGWILVLHTQSRISSLAPLFLYIPLGRGALQFTATFVAFYIVAAPIAGAVALTDVFTHSIALKMGFCVGTSTIAQTVMAIFNFIYLYRLDWQEAGRIINRRANTDRQRPEPEQVEGSDGLKQEIQESELQAQA